jgi:hypothetical protein
VKFVKRKGKNKELGEFFPHEIKGDSSRGITTQSLLATLKGVSEYRTAQQIAQSKNVGVKTVYKQIQWLKQNGYLNADNSMSSKGVAYASGSLRVCDKLLRLHNLRFRVEIIKYRDRNFLKQRRQFLEMSQIPSRTFRKRNWESEFFALDGWRVEVTPKSFLLLAPDILTDRESHEELLGLYTDVKRLVRRLERIFPVVCLEKGERLNVVVEGVHAALVNNVLAKKYNREKRVFELKDGSGDVRLIIDNSLKLHELEAVSPVWAVDDESKVKRLLHEAVIQDISLADMRRELLEMKSLLQAQTEVQKLQLTSGLQVSKQVKSLREWLG